MKAKGKVDEVDAGKIQLKRRAVILLNAHPDEELRGQVDWIANTVQKQTPRKPLKVLRLEMWLHRTDPEKMRPGMRFRGEIEIGRVADAVVAASVGWPISPSPRSSCPPGLPWPSVWPPPVRVSELHPIEALRYE